MELDRAIKRFMLGEGKQRPDIQSYIQMLGEILENLRPSSMRESRRIQIAKTHLNEIRKSARKLNERVNMLEEQVSVLQEANEE